MPPTQKYMKNVKNENRQKLIIFEGFRQNGLQIRIQRIFYVFQHRSKLIFDIFSKMTFFKHENR